MKKKLFKIFLPIMFLMMLFASISVSYEVKADIGFDGDYDSGYDSDYGGGYDSWYDDDDDDDYYYSSGNNSYSGGGGGIGTVGAFMLVFLYVTLIVVIVVVLTKSNKSSSRKEYPIKTTGLPVDDDLNMQVYLLYKQINDAWMNKDLEPIRHLLTDEMYNMYLMQLDTLIENGQTNIMGDYLFVSGHIASKRKYKGKETIIMVFRIKCKDYIVDKNGRVVRGKATDVLDYTYELKLVRDVTGNRLVCPSCGYEVKSKEGVVCPHCGSVIHANTSELRLADKKMIYQSRRRK